MERIWREIAGFPNYSISNYGEVYSHFRGKIMSPKKHKLGYRFVVLCRGYERVPKYIHRLVAEAFIPNPNGYTEVNHKDEDKTNNIVTNLEWCDRFYNMNYGTLWERRAVSFSKTIAARA